MPSRAGRQFVAGANAERDRPAVQRNRMTLRGPLEFASSVHQRRFGQRRSRDDFATTSTRPCNSVQSSSTEGGRFPGYATRRAQSGFRRCEDGAGTGRSLNAVDWEPRSPEPGEPPAPYASKRSQV